jgi:hypothetical protein
MSWNTGSIGNFCCSKTVMALCTTGLSECFFMSSVTTSQRILNLNFSNRYSSITHTGRFLFIYLLYNPPIHKKQIICVSRLLTRPAGVIFGSLIDYQLLWTKSTFNVRRIERNFLLSPMSIALLMHGNWDFTSSSIMTGAMFSPPAVIISSYKNA